jgi:hypothetical protein
MPWVKEQAKFYAACKAARKNSGVKLNGQQSSRGLTGRMDDRAFLPRASAFGLSPGLCSPGPLGRFC